MAVPGGVDDRADDAEGVAPGLGAGPLAVAEPGEHAAPGEPVQALAAEVGVGRVEEQAEQLIAGQYPVIGKQRHELSVPVGEPTLFGDRVSDTTGNHLDAAATGGY